MKSLTKSANSGFSFPPWLTFAFCVWWRGVSTIQFFTPNTHEGIKKSLLLPLLIHFSLCACTLTYTLEVSWANSPNFLLKKDLIFPSRRWQMLTQTRSDSICCFNVVTSCVIRRLNHAKHLMGPRGNKAGEKMKWAALGIKWLWLKSRLKTIREKWPFPIF